MTTIHLRYPAGPDGRILPARQGDETATHERGLFNANRLSSMAREAGLSFPDTVLGAVIAALRSQKHVVLIGPPATGKSTLAKLVAELGRQAMMCSGHVSATATSNWTVAQTVGSSHESTEGLAFRPGVVLEAMESGRWLIIDELNRADLDRALGELFSVLSGQEVVLPFKRTTFGQNISLVPFGAPVPPHTDAIRVPKAWRIIATMNAYDRRMLFQMSRALMRRFAFVNVDSPDDSVFRSLVAGPGAIVAKLLPLRELSDLGPGIYIDASEYAAQRLQDGVSDSLVLLEVLNAFFVPQLDELDDAQTAWLLGSLEGLLDPADLRSVSGLLRGFAAGGRA